MNVAPKKRTCGFRFSRVDAFVILVCTALTILLWEEQKFVLILPFVLGHFFLFCNVFRIRNRFELIWSGVFLLNACCWVADGHETFSWVSILATQTPVTVVLILAEIFSRRYHGVGSRILNRKYVHMWESGELE